MPHILKHKALLWQWTKRLLGLRYAGSFLGPLWNLATPLLMLAVYTFVFAVVFKARWALLNPDLETTGSYSVILFCGMAIFNVFSETVNGCCRCVIDNPNLVKKVIFPLQILPIAQALAAVCASAFWFLLVLIAALVAGMPLYLTILAFPLVLIPLFALALGIGLFVAATTVYLRDMPHFTAMILQALFFMTPIFYPESLVPANLAFILRINPLAWLCRQGRSLLLLGEFPGWLEICETWLVCFLICYAGYFWFHKLKQGFADVL